MMPRGSSELMADAKLTIIELLGPKTKVKATETQMGETIEFVIKTSDKNVFDVHIDNLCYLFEQNHSDIAEVVQITPFRFLVDHDYCTAAGSAFDSQNTSVEIFTVAKRPAQSIFTARGRRFAVQVMHGVEYVNLGSHAWAKSVSADSEYDASMGNKVSCLY